MRDFVASVSRNGTERDVKTSAKPWKWIVRKSNRPPTSAATLSTLACEPPASPATRISVVAVASGNGYSPCMSATK